MEREIRAAFRDGDLTRRQRNRLLARLDDIVDERNFARRGGIRPGERRRLFRMVLALEARLDRAIGRSARRVGYTVRVPLL
ncbi:MAG: hypothetical protein AAFR55_08630 [Pseudomonadota bacterium]